MRTHENIAPTLRANAGGHEPIVFPQRAYGEYGDSEAGSTLRATGGSIGGGRENIAVVYENHRKDARYNARADNAPTLTSMMGTGGGNVPLTISRSYSLCTSHTGKHGPPFKAEMSFCLTTDDHHVAERVARKLTPRECERLQGLPDDYTAYGSDSKRYKALGNGMAQPCADYVMGQVVKAIMRGLEKE